MTTTTVDTNTTDVQALATASADRTRNGTTSDQDGTVVHIGGGLYLSAGHVFYQYVNPDDPRTADDYRLTVGEGLASEYGLTVSGPDFSSTFTNYGWGANGGADVSSVLTADTTDVEIPLIIYADPNEASGTLTSYGFPVDGGYDGSTMVQVSGNLTTNSHMTVPTGNGDATVLISDIGMQVYSGQSGSGVWLTNDVDGDGQDETYLAGIVSLDVQYVGGLHATGFEPMGDIYAALGQTIDDAGLDADDFARATLVSGQTLGSSHTSLTGTALHEDLLGGVNSDTLDGAAGDDMLTGKGGADDLSGGAGRDVLLGGAGDDTLRDGDGVDDMTGGTGADTYVMARDNASDVIRDFEDGTDTIDVSAWGVDDVSELTITNHKSGRVLITFGKEALMVDDGARSLDASDFSNVDFTLAGGVLPIIQGTDDSDKIFGGAAAEEIRDGAGIDRMFGKGGADEFVLSADGDADWIKDWEDGQDLMDVSAWSVTAFEELSVAQHGNGRVVIAHGAEQLYVSDAGRTLGVSDIDASDFIFA